MPDEESNVTEQEREYITNRLHSLAIHLLRRVRKVDPLTGLSPARLSALSVIGFGGPRTISELAEVEQVALPTISRIVAALAEEGLVERQVDDHDRRTIHLTITPKGLQVLREGQRRRTEHLGNLLAQLTPTEQEVVAQALDSLERTLHAPEES